MTEWFTRDEARNLTARILGFSKAEGCQVNLSSNIEGNTRSAGNGVTTSGETRNASVTISSHFGRRSASATTNLFDDAALRRAVETSERLARLAPEDPELMPLLGPAAYAEVPALFRSTVELGAEARAGAAKAAADVCQAAGLVGAGFIHRRAGAECVANSAELFSYHASSAAIQYPDGAHRRR